MTASGAARAWDARTDVAVDRPAAPADAVRAEGVSLTFDAGGQAVHALSDIHLSIPQGSFTSLIGPDPVISRKPEGAWSHAVFEAASR